MKKKTFTPSRAKLRKGETTVGAGAPRESYNKKRIKRIERIVGRIKK